MDIYEKTTKLKTEDSGDCVTGRKDPITDVQKKDTDMTKVDLLQRKFVISIPSKNKYNIDKVTISCAELKSLNGTILQKMDHPNIYSCVVCLPVILDKHIEYLYEVKYVSPGFFRDSEDIKRSHKQVLSERSVQRDFWSGYNPTSVIAHLNHIIFLDVMPLSQGLKDEVIQIENVLGNPKHFPHGQGLFDLIGQLQNKHTKEAVLCVVVIGIICQSNHDILHQVINPEKACLMLNQINNLKLSDFPSSCEEYLPAVCKSLCQIADGSKSTILTTILRCHHFLDEQLFNRWIERSCKAELASNDKANTEAAVKLANFSVYKIRKQQKDSKEYRELETFLKYLIYNCALPILLHICKLLLTENLQEEQNMLQDVIEIVIDKVFIEAKTVKITEHLFNVLQIIADKDLLQNKFKGKIEEEIISLLKTGIDKKFVLEVVKQNMIFDTEKSKVEFLKEICNSTSQDILSIFHQIIGMPKFIDCQHDGNLDIFKTWFQTLTKLYSRYEKQGKIFMLYKRTFEVCLAVKVPLKERVVKEFDNLLYHYLENLNIKEFLQTLGEIESVCPEHYIPMCEGHVKRLLQLKTRKMPVKEVINCITPIRKPIMDSRLIVFAVVVVLEDRSFLLDSESDISGVEKMATDTDLWIPIFSYKGKYLYIMENSLTYKHGCQKVKAFLDKLQNYDIPYKIFEKGSNLLMKDFLLNVCSSNGVSRTLVDHLWTENSDRLHKMKKELDRLQNIVYIIKEQIQADVPPTFDSFHDQICSLMNDFMQMFPSDLKKELQLLFYEQKIFNECKNSSIIVHSQVYWNLYRNKFNSSELISELKCSEREEENILEDIRCLFEKINIEELSDNKLCTQFVCTVLENGNKLFTNNWINLQENPDIEMSHVFSMFSGCFSNIQEEFRFAEEFLRQCISKPCKDTLHRLSKLEKMINVVNTMESAVIAFEFDLKTDPEFDTAIISFRKLIKNTTLELSFKQVSELLGKVYEVSESWTDITLTVIEAIGKASSLIKFLSKIIDEDIRNLIDAVEDISEQHVSESTVSALIETKRFFKPLLSVSWKNCFEVLNDIHLQVGRFGENVKMLPLKIYDCMDNLHNLISLYNNVANRGEQTKQIVLSIIKQGTFHFQLDTKHKICKFTVTYTQQKNKQKVEHNKAALSDFRSRSLLIMNSERQSKNVGDLEDFVKAIDRCSDISENICLLHISGHFKYPCCERSGNLSQLDDINKSLTDDLNTWNQLLKEIRKEHYLMNFLQGLHIHVLYQYLEQNDSNNLVDVVLKFIHPGLKSSILKDCYNQLKDELSCFSSDDFLTTVGKAITLCNCKLVSSTRQITTIDTSDKRVTDMVITGRILVVHLDNDTTVNTLLALYLRTTRRLPEPSEVLLCTRNTNWNEVELLLERCFGANEFFQEKTLYCIANVELLTNEIHFKLVEHLKNIESRSEYLLAIICRGSASQSFFDEFYENVSKVRPLSDETVQILFEEFCPNVCTYSSDSAGLGKTTAILASAKQVNRTVRSLHISGPINKRLLVERLQRMNVKGSELLHIDIGYIDNSVELDTFLFELIILGFTVAEGIAVDLKTPYVCIEIANTINSILRDSLHTAISFKREHLTWHGHKDFVISKEVNSPVQVACHYLYCLEKGNADKCDLKFSGETCVRPLSTKVCRYLLQTYFVSNDNFITTNICIRVLADQLKKMSNSTFFKVSRIRDMVGNKNLPTVKSSLVKALIDVTKELAIRSVDAYRNTQQSTLESGPEAKHKNKKMDLASAATKHTKHMIRWEESNHLIYVFHNQNIQTISPMYRKKSLVPEHIKNLFESQMKSELSDFQQLSQNELQIFLQKIVRTNPKSLSNGRLAMLSNEYALTPDNLLKMVLIILRIKSRVPVLVMGETGCGKTSLIRYLAAICEVPFDVVSIHAGVEEKSIVKRVLENNSKALSNLDKEQWLFLDEINTSQYIGLISDMVCHHRCFGKLLSPNLVILSACNPYKLRSKMSILTSGLKGKVKTDELSCLVYRVLPLPEMLVDYVWDFGSLTETDEKVYIDRMVAEVFKEDQDMHGLFVDLLAMSQTYARCVEETSSTVSLRDIHRCKILTEWFLQTLLKKTPKREMEYRSRLSDKKIPAILLSLSHCYMCRFADKNKRKSYLEKIEQACIHHNKYVSSDLVEDIIRQEQQDILLRMELPSGTAQNTALRENIFVILVCILNRIPIFVVGKPGCSKSLSLQVIKSNLRGKDSKDDFLQTLPQLYCVSFQGSESSTSDGILKVFEKAEKYQEANDNCDVLSVVILDEIGLAEISRFNPLKVLHNLLEPDGQSRPNVAVVGISNWSLDASKMNRAIHLSRPDMDVDELIDTAKSISDSFEKEEQIAIIKEMDKHKYYFKTTHIEKELKALAESYMGYILAIRFENFHGLRDYYCLVKYIANAMSDCHSHPSNEKIMHVISNGLERNFGGLPAEKQMLRKKFQLDALGGPFVLDLIKENANDPLARHLMIISTGDTVLGIIERSLKEAGRERKEILFGSQFEEDLTDEYNYRMLSRIILCMEQGMVLILKNLKNIYGSLYDMLNKNYSEINGKKHCRVALGPYSNPICHVHDYFRCIVIINANDVDYTDPPFLNRFEKQTIRFSDVINDKQRELIDKLENWIDALCQIEGRHFRKENCFPVYSKDMVASYVLHKNVMEMENFSEIKNNLLWIIKPESIVRLKKAADESVRNESEKVQDKFFSLPLHNGLYCLIENKIEKKPAENLQEIIFTSSSIHSRYLYQIPVKKQIEKLGAFKSEKQLSSRIKHFWLHSDTEFLFMQCNAVDDEKHIMLAKSMIERNRLDYMTKTSELSRKHVFLIIHLDTSKTRSQSISQINFLSGWDLSMLDSLDTPPIPLPDLIKMSQYEAVLSKRPLNGYIKNQLFWAFTRIKYYKQGRDVDSIERVCSFMKHSNSFTEVLEERVFEYTKTNLSQENGAWHESVACDLQVLETSLTFSDALEKHIMHTINVPLAKIIFQLEILGIADSYFIEDCMQDDRRNAWIRQFSNENVFSITEIHDTLGPETYECKTKDMSLKMPFSLFIFQTVETTCEEYLHSIMTLKQLCELDEDEDLPSVIVDKLAIKQSAAISKIIDINGFVYSGWIEDYVDDFCNIMSFDRYIAFERRIHVMKLLIQQKCTFDGCSPLDVITSIHTVYWRHSERFHDHLQLLAVCQGDILFEQNNFDLIESVLNELIEKRYYSEMMYRDTVEDIHSDSIAISDHENDYEDLVCENVINQTEVRFDNDIENITKNESTPGVDQDIENSQMQEDKKELHNSSEDSIRYDFSTEMINTTLNISTESNEIEQTHDITKEDDIPSKSNKKYTDSPEEKDIAEIFDLKEIKIDNNDYDDNNDISEDITELQNIICQLRPSDRIVHVLCKHLLPTKNLLDLYGGLKSWFLKCNAVIRLAANVSHDAPMLHSLRLCNDIVHELLQQNISFSFQLENIAKQLKSEQAMDSLKVFNLLVEILIDLNSEDFSRAQILLSTYLSRCLSFNSETRALEYFFDTLQENKIPFTKLLYLKPPISIAISSECDSFYFDLIENPETCEEVLPFLKSLNLCLKHLHESNSSSSEIFILIIDILEDKYKEILIDKDESVLKQKSVLFLQCHRVLQGKFTVSFMAAVAYCKVYISQCIIDGGEYSQEHLDAVLPAFMSIDENKVDLFLCKLLLKLIGREKPFAKAWMLFNVLKERFSIFENLKWDEDDVTSCIEMRPLMICCTEQSEHSLQNLVASNEKDCPQVKIKNLIEHSKRSASNMCGFLGDCIQYFYLPRLYTRINDTKRMHAMAIEEECTILGNENKCLLKCIVGKQDFDVEEFNIHPGSSSTAFFLSKTLISLYCLLQTEFEFSDDKKQMPILTKCLLKPALLKECFIPGMPESSAVQNMSYKLSVLEKFRFHTCSCNIRLCTRNEHTVCERCDMVICQEKQVNPNNVNVNDTQRGYITHLPSDDVVCRNMSSVIYHILSILIKGCIIGSVAIGQATSADLEVLGVPEDGAYIWNELENHWKCTLEAVNVPEYMMALIFKAIFYKARNFMCKTITQMHEESERIEWEIQFSILLHEILLNRFTYIQDLFSEHTGGNIACIEGDLRELGDIKTLCNEKRRQNLTDLLRLQGETNIENFRFELEEQSEKFLFIEYVLQNYEQLKLPRHIICLVQWHLLVVSSVNYTMRRHECLRMTVDDFIHLPSYKVQRDLRRKRFTALRASWENVFKTMKDEKLSCKYIHFHGQTKLSDCLILDQTSVVYEVLLHISAIQNDFIDTSLAIAQLCESAKFLCTGTNTSSIKCIDITDITLKHLVHFEESWEDFIADYTQSNLSYGCGQHIIYNFASIEKALAVLLLNGKAFISLKDALPRIIFSDEFYKNFAMLVSDLRGTIKQISPLPKSIKEAICDNHEKDPKMASELVRHLGVVMALMKKTSGEPDMSLVDYTDHWGAIMTHTLPHSYLPSPANCIKLESVVAMHELLEELCAKPIIDSLEEEYMQRIDVDIESHFSNLVHKRLYLAEIVLGTIKRFVFRCLQIRDADSKQLLCSYITDTSFWPVGIVTDGIISLGEERLPVKTIIPEGLVVGHVHSTVTFLENEIQEKRNNDLNMTGMAATFNTSEIVDRGVQTRSKRKQKIAKKKFNF